MPRQNPDRPIGVEEAAARRVAYERSRRGWSTDELARRVTEAGCPINQSAIWRIESGEPRRKITLDEAYALARVFGIEVSDLTQSSLAPRINDVRAARDELREKIVELADALEGLQSALGGEDGTDDELAQEARWLLAEGIGQGVKDGLVMAGAADIDTSKLGAASRFPGARIFRPAERPSVITLDDPRLQLGEPDESQESPS